MRILLISWDICLKKDQNTLNAVPKNDSRSTSQFTIEIASDEDWIGLLELDELPFLTLLAYNILGVKKKSESLLTLLLKKGQNAFNAVPKNNSCSTSQFNHPSAPLKNPPGAVSPSIPTIPNTPMKQSHQARSQVSTSGSFFYEDVASRDNEGDYNQRGIQEKSG